jgi:hypothetical protein
MLLLLLLLPEIVDEIFVWWKLQWYFDDDEERWPCYMKNHNRTMTTMMDCSLHHVAHIDPVNTIVGDIPGTILVMEPIHRMQ